MNYFVDYFGYCLGGIGNRMRVKNRNERLLFDILSINPTTDILIFSLPETLLEDSNRVLINYKDFWKNNIFKIALDKKYKSANAYINNRLELLSKSIDKHENYELDIYQTEIPNYFINDFLINSLNLRGKNSFIFHRINNADTNHRLLLKEKINNYDLLYINLSQYLNEKDIDALINYFNNQADDKKSLFQRGYILNQVFEMYPVLNSNRSFLYDIFDNNYNDAMALAVNAQRLSTLVHTINGASLSKFIYNYDNNIYKKICQFTPHQIFMLSQNISWLNFVQKIKELYEYLYINKCLSQNYNIYKYYQRKIKIKKYAFDFIIKTIDYIINQTNIPIYYWYDYLINLKKSINDYIYTYILSQDYMFYITSDIYDRKKSIQTIVNDICNI